MKVLFWKVLRWGFYYKMDRTIYLIEPNQFEIEYFTKEDGEIALGFKFFLKGKYRRVFINEYDYDVKWSLSIENLK